MVYAIDNDIIEKLDYEQKIYDTYRKDYSEFSTSKKISLSKLDYLNKKLESISEKNKLIEENKSILLELKNDFIDWSYIAKALQPANIPALELEMSIQSIDNEATRILLPFMDGQYSVRTEAADGFDIIIYDSLTGTETSFFKKNPGHKAFFADAYTKALIKQRNERQHRKYSPIIMDEADAPIESESVQVYYKIQDDYFSNIDSKVLVVSHKGTGHIENTIEVKELQSGNS
jgi:hypothetical protein